MEMRYRFLNQKKRQIRFTCFREFDNDGRHIEISHNLRPDKRISSGGMPASD